MYFCSLKLTRILCYEGDEGNAMGIVRSASPTPKPRREDATPKPPDTDHHHPDTRRECAIPIAHHIFSSKKLITLCDTPRQNLLKQAKDAGSAPWGLSQKVQAMYSI